MHKIKEKERQLGKREIRGVEPGRKKTDQEDWPRRLAQ